MTPGILLGQRSLGTDGEFGESLALQGLFFMYLQFKIICIQQWCILGWPVLRPFTQVRERTVGTQFGFPQSHGRVTAEAQGISAGGGEAEMDVAVRQR